MSDVYAVDVEYYMLVPSADELVQNSGTGDVETPVREAAQNILGAPGASVSERADEAIDSRCRSLMANVGQSESDIGKVIKSVADTDRESVTVMSWILEHVKGYPKAKPGSGGKVKIA